MESYRCHSHPCPRARSVPPCRPWERAPKWNGSRCRQTSPHGDCPEGFCEESWRIFRQEEKSFLMFQKKEKVDQNGKNGAKIRKNQAINRTSWPVCWFGWTCQTANGSFRGWLCGVPPCRPPQWSTCGRRRECWPPGTEETWPCDTPSGQPDNAFPRPETMQK